jgi:UDP-N-acetylmuramoylalanine--D-glutamate ligase
MSNLETISTTLRGKRVVVYGLGRFGGGVGVVRYLAKQGADVIVADDLPRAELEHSISLLNDVAVAAWIFEAADNRLPACDLIVANPGLPPSHSLFADAKSETVPVTSEIELFCLANSARIIAVTGSNGKSTTAAMIAHILFAAGFTCHLGGNFGGSLLSELENIKPHHIVVLELSSFQLARLSSESLQPTVAVLTNFSPNHLDWHPSLDHYRSSKQRLFERLLPESVAVFPSNETQSFFDWSTQAERTAFGADFGESGVFASEGTVVFRTDRGEEAFREWTLRIPGEHNRLNSLAAAAAVVPIGVSTDIIFESLQTFDGVPMRLQVIDEVNMRTFVNDSASTTPESTIFALGAYPRPVVLIAGGADKGLDLSEMAIAVAENASFASWTGQTADALSNAARRHSPAFPQQTHESLESAFAAAVDVSKPGDIVILSPGCASFGMYANFQERGRHFDELVRCLSQSDPLDD